MMRAAAAAALVVVVAGAARAAAPDFLTDGCAPDAAEAKRKKQAAAERYRKGQELYAQGEYEAAIVEFRATYCLVPVPEAVYNVAQAYERLVDYQKAVAWFEAYLRMLPPGNREEAVAVENRLKILRKLPARIRVATDPPGASIKLSGPAGEKAGLANAEPLRVAAGTYTMKIELPGYQPIEEQVTAEIGQPYTYSYRLSPQTGVLRVTTRPGGARILLDDKVVGAGRFVDRVPVGEHHISVEYEQRPTEKRTVVVTSSEDARVRVEMKPPRPRNGKIELVIASTALAMIEGGVFITGVTDDKAWIGSVTVGFGALGFAAPYFFLPENVPTGQTSLMIGGRVWGGLEGVAIATLLYNDLGDSRKETSFLYSGSAIAGGLISYGIARKLDLSAGESALVNSGGLWGTSGGLLFASWLGASGRTEVGPILFTSLNVGLAAGAVLAKLYEPSRGRMFLIDLSGVAGLVSGTALAGLIGRDSESMAGFALGGMVIGLGVGTWVTRHVDEDTELTPVASVGNGTFVLGLAGRW